MAPKPPKDPVDGRRPDISLRQPNRSRRRSERVRTCFREGAATAQSHETFHSNEHITETAMGDRKSLPLLIVDPKQQEAKEIKA